jgi:hypothetical protein
MMMDELFFLCLLIEIYRLYSKLWVKLIGFQGFSSFLRGDSIRKVKIDETPSLCMWIMDRSDLI